MPMLCSMGLRPEPLYGGSSSTAKGEVTNKSKIMKISRTAFMTALTGMSNALSKLAVCLDGQGKEGHNKQPQKEGAALPRP